MQQQQNDISKAYDQKLNSTDDEPQLGISMISLILTECLISLSAVSHKQSDSHSIRLNQMNN